MGVKRRSIWLWRLYCCFWILSIGVRADGQSRVAISQLSFQHQVITAYLDIRDQNGQVPANLSASDFSATLQGQSLKVSSVSPFDASGEGVTYLFLLDISKSITAAQFSQNQRFTTQWIEGLGPADRMAVGTVGADYRQVADFTGDKASLESSVAALKLTDRQTKLYDALKNAAAIGAAQGLPGRRVIVVLSDGLDEGSNITEDDAISALKQSHVPVYALGASHLPQHYRQQGLYALNRIASSTDGLYFDATAKPLASFGGDLKSAIRGVSVASIPCENCQPSTQANPLEIIWNGGGAPATSTFDAGLMLPSQAVPSQGSPQIHLPWWQLIWDAVWGFVRSKLGLALLIILLIAIVIFVIVRRKKRPEIAGVVLSEDRPPPAKPAVVAAGARGLPLRFTTVGGMEAGKEYRLKLVERIIVGRDRECDLALSQDTEVSGRHCELSLDDHAVWLADLESRNGTLLNGARVVARRRLESGDLIRAGRTELRVTFEEAQ